MVKDCNLIEAQVLPLQNCSFGVHVNHDSLLPFKYRDILRTLLDFEVKFLLIGGMNFFLAHQPISTQDIDVLIEDSAENRQRCELALIAMEAEWGKGDSDWGPVSEKASGWLNQQFVYCLLTKFGPLDIFRSVKGVNSFQEASKRSGSKDLEDGVIVPLLSANDLLECQLVLPVECQRLDRVAYLKRLLGQ